MSEHWLARLLGLENVPPDATWQFTLTGAPHSWGVFVLIAAVVAGFVFVTWLYKWEIDTCPRWGKRLLATVRFAVLLLLVLIFLGPAVTFTQQKTLWPAILVLRDSSRSMSTADRYLDDRTAGQVAAATGESIDSIREKRPTRSMIVDHLLVAEEGRLRKDLGQLGKVKVFDFSNDIAPVLQQSSREGPSPPETDSENQPPTLPLLEAAGPGTDLHRAISTALSERLISAVVILTDGQHTVKETSEADFAAVADQARQKNAPFLVVGVGDPTRPRNLSVTDLYADPQVWKEDPFEIQAVLRAQNIDEPAVRVELVEQKLAEDGTTVGGEQVLQGREVVLASPSQHKRLSFTHIPREAGRFHYTVRVAPIPGEQTEDDNQPDAPLEVKVLDEKARVLLVAGAPSWEYQLLHRLLAREKSINLSCWLQTMDTDRQQHGNTPLRQLPRTKANLFEFDCVLFIDPDPKDFDSEWIKLLKQFVVEHSGGVLYMAGPRFTGRFLTGSSTREIADVLPVSLGDVGKMEVASLLATHDRQWDLGIVRANVDHPIMRFYGDPDRSLRQWRELPGIYWSFPSEEAKPAARVLIEHTNPALTQSLGPRPLLVTGLYGSGRTVFVGFNGTWRWRKVSSDAEFYKRFWIQSTRYLIEGRSVEGKRRGILETERNHYTLGDRINVTARLKTATFEPLVQPEIEARLTISGEPAEPVTLKPVPNQPGQYQAMLTARQKGTHLLQIELPADNLASPAVVETSFSVVLPSVETAEVWLNKPFLVELAHAAGGQYFGVNQMNELVAAIPDRRQQLSITSQPFTLWDNYRMLLLLVGLLTVEWALRKRFRLL